MRGGPWWREKFAGHGHRLTAPREAILEILIRSRKHLSAEDVYMQVHKVYPGIGLATVYRTLELLRQMGLVSKFHFGDGRSRYEVAEGPGVQHHHHMVCRNCGRIIDCSELIDEQEEAIKRLERTVSKKHKFKIESHQIQFFGLCEKCG